MKIGLIARDEAMRGLAIQSKGFYDHIPVERVLLVRMRRLDCLPGPNWYPGATEIHYDDYNHRLLERDVVCDWLKGLDVVFTVETPYDWQLPNWARDLGVKTVIQGNPEFYRHDQEEWSHQAQPDAWWWPTDWRLDRLPTGKVVPVPMPDVERTARPAGGTLRALHVCGKRAWADRNGTDVVTNCVRSIQEPIELTINGINSEITEVRNNLGSPATVKLVADGVTDRWSMYADQQILVLPRRYGGNCLPALEAAACGLGVLMPDVSPNQMLASKFISGRNDRLEKLACGLVPMADTDFVHLAHVLDELARHPEEVQKMQDRSFEMVPRWSEYRQIYLDELEAVCNL